MSIHVKVVRFCWPGARPRALGEQEIKDRVGFPYSLRLEAWRLRRAPAGSAEVPTAQRVKVMCKTHINEIALWLRRKVATVGRQVAARDLGAWFRRFAPITSKAARSHALNKEEYVAEAGTLERAKQEAEDAVAVFKAVQGIDRAPIEPSHPLLPVALIFALVTVEAGVSTPLFAKVSDYGDVGGFLMALAFSVLPPVLGVLAGFFGIRMMRRKQVSFRLLGGSIVITVIGKMSVYGLIVAHLRLVLTAKPSATLADALASLAASWWGVAGSAEASGLLAISVFAFALGIYEGAQRLADPLWGYSALHRRVEEATEELEALEDSYRKVTEQVGCDARTEIDAVEAAGVKEFKGAADDVEQLIRAHDYANLISRTTRLNCDAVLRLCDGELKDMGWNGQPAPLALPAPAVSTGAAGSDDGDVLGPAEDKPSRILGGILRQEGGFRTIAEEARAEVAADVSSHLLGLPTLRRRISDYVRKHLHTPILMRGPFDPAREVLS